MAVNEDDARRMLGRNPLVNVRAWTEFLVALLEKPAIVVAGVAQVLHEPLLSRIASESQSAG